MRSVFTVIRDDRSLFPAQVSTHVSGSDLDALVVEVHARDDDRHLARTLETQHVRLLSTSIEKLSCIDPNQHEKSRNLVVRLVCAPRQRFCHLLPNDTLSVEVQISQVEAAVLPESLRQQIKLTALPESDCLS